VTTRAGSKGGRKPPLAAVFALAVSLAGGAGLVSIASAAPAADVAFVSFHASGTARLFAAGSCTEDTTPP
jgi:hypothetical protein